MTSNRFPFSHSARIWHLRYFWYSLIPFIFITLFTQIWPARAEVSMKFNGYELRYEQGTVNISEDLGLQFIDIVDVIITSRDGERFTADKLLLRATGTPENFNWIQKAEIVNAKLTTTRGAAQEVKLTSSLIQIENIHLSQPSTLDELAKRHSKNRTKQSYFAVFDFDLDMPKEGLRVEIDSFLADANPDLINQQLPEGQYVSEARVINARLLPFGMGEASLVFQLILKGLNVDAMRFDMQASLLNQISATQIDGDVRVELNLDQLLGLDIDVKTTIRADDYNQLLAPQISDYGLLDPTTELAQATSFFHQLTIALSDSGAWQVYDDLSGIFGLPDRRQLALLATHKLREQLSYSAALLTVPIADFIGTGGQLLLSAQPNLLSENDMRGGTGDMLEQMINKADIRLQHVP
jgi:hypothetical protein